MAHAYPVQKFLLRSSMSASMNSFAAATAAKTQTVSRHYTLQCKICGMEVDDDGLQLDCPGQHAPALLQTNYAESRLVPLDTEPGIYRYRNWLPVRTSLTGSGRTLTYRSESLSHVTGISELWVAFHGYWPDRGAMLDTGTFKDLEAYSVLARLPQEATAVLVVASAGNTAAAFARACSLNGVRCVIIIPEAGLSKMRFAEPLERTVRLVALSSPADYADAIALSERVAGLPGFVREGGALNVARRAGLGTALLNAVETIGRLPDYYFQAVGSGAGAIGVHEAAKRIANSGAYGTRLPYQILSQNLPFIPIYLAWKAGRRDWPPIDCDDARRYISRIMAGVLSNRRPPYSIAGGVFDTLTESNGDMMAADNAEARAAAALFEQGEGIDIDPAGAVALATLLKASRDGQIEPDATVLLNITGGGNRQREIAGSLHQARPDLTVVPAEAQSESVLSRIADLFS
jgi:cysteate synthase